MQRHDRLSAVLEMVARQRSLTVEDLTSTFGISGATARRDLDDLAEQQLITRTRGGAVAHTLNYDLPLRYKTGRQSDQKRRIASAAAALAQPGSVIGLNGGTTNTEVARSLVARIDAAGSPNGNPLSITVVTNALNIANELAVRPMMKIVVIGGVLRPQSFELTGPFAHQVLSGVTMDLTILGVDAISPEHGAAAVDEGEALINRIMVQRSEQVVVVADSSKLSRRAFCTISEVAEIDILITDTDADPDVIDRFTQAGITVQTV